MTPVQAFLQAQQRTALPARPTSMVTIHDILAALSRARQKTSALPVLVVPSHKVDWRTFPSAEPEGGALSMEHARGWRQPLSDGSSLHIQQWSRPQVTKFHIDSVCPRRDLVSHVAKDTHIIEGAVLGLTALALAPAAATLTAVRVVGWALAGAGAGAVATQMNQQEFKLRWQPFLRRWVLAD